MSSPADCTAAGVCLDLGRDYDLDMKRSRLEKEMARFAGVLSTSFCCQPSCSLAHVAGVTFSFARASGERGGRTARVTRRLSGRKVTNGARVPARAPDGRACAAGASVGTQLSPSDRGHNAIYVSPATSAWDSLVHIGRQNCFVLLARN